MSAQTEQFATPGQQEKTAQFMVVTGLVAILALAVLGAYISGLYGGGLGLAGILSFVVAAVFAWARYGLVSAGMGTALFWGLSGVFFWLVG